MTDPAEPIPFHELAGVSIGHATAGRSGVTVIRFSRAAPTTVRVLGGASATYDLASLALDATFGRRWAIFLSGGSVYGLDAARGVREAVLADGGGSTVFRSTRRIAPISGAALFDLPLTTGRLPNYARLGRSATERADRRPFALGRAGAGKGATVGKYLGRSRAMPGGLGAFARRTRAFGGVGVLVVVNAVGAVVDPRTGSWIAGAWDDSGRIDPPPALGRDVHSDPGTTLAVVVVEADVDRSTLDRIAAVAAGGLARAIVPFASAVDGDVVFAASTQAVRRRWRARLPVEAASALGSLAGRVATEAVLTAFGIDPTTGP